VLRGLVARVLHRARAGDRGGAGPCQADRRDHAVPRQPVLQGEADAAAARARELGYDVLVNVHDDDANKQDQLIEVAIARKVSAIVLDNAGADASVAAVRKATAAGIPSILIDREINVTGVAAAQIVSNNYQGRPWRGGVREAPRREGQLHRAGRPGIGHQRGRAQPGVPRRPRQVPGSPDGRATERELDQREAFQKTETLIQANRGIRGVIAGNDTMALGAMAALKGAGLGHLVVVGFDGSPDAIASIKAGEIKATVLQPAAYIARLAVDQAHALITKGSTGQPEKQAIDCELVTQANAGEFGVFARK